MAEISPVAQDIIAVLLLIITAICVLVGKTTEAQLFIWFLAAKLGIEAILKKKG